MAVTIALLGDTMLGRKVAERVTAAGPRSVFAPEIRDVLRDADLVLANLECCISDRGSRWPAPGKPFFFRAPPQAAETLAWLGVTDATLANNHALDYGADALLDTRKILSNAGIRAIGAGATVAEARAPTRVGVAGLRLAFLGVTDHPEDFAARDGTPNDGTSAVGASGVGTPGVAYADLETGVPDWLIDQVRSMAEENDVVIVTPHWGPNMTSEPLDYVSRAARVLVDSGATVVAGHSAHVFHGVGGPAHGGTVLYDLGDFIDDYMVHRELRNDRGLIWMLTFDRFGPIRLRAIPIALDFCFTRLANPVEYAWIRDRFVSACAAFGTEVTDRGDHLVVYWD